MVKKPDVKTVATARNMSLIKWNRAKGFNADLFNEIDKSCGFCDLGDYLGKPKKMWKCDVCPVRVRCSKIQGESSNLEEKMIELIDETIKFLEDMDVNPK